MYVESVDGYLWCLQSMAGQRCTPLGPWLQKSLTFFWLSSKSLEGSECSDPKVVYVESMAKRVSSRIAMNSKPASHRLEDILVKGHLASTI